METPDPLERDAARLAEMAEAADAELDQGMSSEERVDYIYRDLAAVSTRVRRSMLVYNCVSSDYTDTDDRTGTQVVRRVLWMTTSHPFFPVIRRLAEHYRVSDQYGPSCVIHCSELAKIPMRGVDSQLVNQVADMIWSHFLANTERYPVYDEDGTRLESGVPVTGDDQDPKTADHVVVTVDDVSEGILIGTDQHAHLYVAAPAMPVPEVNDHPKKE